MKSFLCSFTLMAAIVSSPTYAFDVSLVGAYHDLSISGQVQSSGTLIDVENTLGMEGDESVGAAFRLDGERHHFWFNYLSIDYQGTATLSRNITFEGQVFTVNSNVASSFEYNQMEFQYHYDLWNSARFAVSPLFKVDGYDAKVQISDSTNALSQSYDQTLALPSVGLNVRVDPNEYFHAMGQVNGLAFDDSSFLEYQALIGFTPFRHLGVELGYKKKKIDFDDGTDIIDVEEDGWFAGIVLSYSF